MEGEEPPVAGEEEAAPAPAEPSDAAAPDAADTNEAAAEELAIELAAPSNAPPMDPGQGLADRVAAEARLHERDPEDMGNLPEHLEAPSRLLARLLRHNANEVGLRIDNGGWAMLDDVLALIYFQANSADDMKEIVRESYSKDRPRFELKFEDECLWIRATHKSSMRRGRQHYQRRQQDAEAEGGGGEVASDLSQAAAGPRYNPSASASDWRGADSRAYRQNPAGMNGNGRINQCRAFQRGQCTYGDRCKFSHDPEEGRRGHVPRVVLPPPHMAKAAAKAPPPQLGALKEAAEEAVWEEQENSRDGQPPAEHYLIGDEAEMGRRGHVQQCRQFQGGHCSFGDRCRFLHDDGCGGDVRGSPPSANGYRKQQWERPPPRDGAASTAGVAEGQAHNGSAFQSWPSWGEIVGEKAAESARDQAAEGGREDGGGGEADAGGGGEGEGGGEGGEEEEGAAPLLLDSEAEALRPWQKYAGEPGQGYWYWREDNNDWFLEDDPGDWVKYLDPGSGKAYWWKGDDSDWFWDRSNEEWLARQAAAE